MRASNMAEEILFESAEKEGSIVAVAAHPQTVVSPGPTPNTATIISPEGRTVCVVGDYRDVEVKLQAAAARIHEDGTEPRQNWPVS